MIGAFQPASRGRLLVIASHSSVSDVLAEAKTRAKSLVVALLTAHEITTDHVELESTVRTLLDNGCEYFVCFGDASEALHDEIDELLEERVAAGLERTVMTTWHDDEAPTDVAEFFFNVAGAKDGTLLVAVIGQDDAELAKLLAQQASGS